MIKKIFPFLDWVPKIKENIKVDLIVGLTVALVLIPQSMAYAQLAGLPPYYGLYAAFLPGVIAILWGSSSHLATGPVAMTSLLTASTLAPFMTDGDNVTKYIHLAIILAFLVGVIRIIVGVCKLTFIVNFLSQPVIRGFINAGALIIGASQVSKIFGLEMHKTGWFLRDISNVFADIYNTHIPTLIIGIFSIITIGVLKKYYPKIPSALIVMVLSILSVYFLNLSIPESGAVEGCNYVAVIGEIPAGLPVIAMPNFAGYAKEMIQLIPGAIMVMFIGFMEVCSVTKAISAQSKEKIDLNQELIGQGLSAIVGSFSQCYPTSGSFSRSALNYSAGGKTGMSSVFTGIFVLITLLFLTPLLYYLPQASLAAIIIMAVAGLIDFKIILSFWKVSKLDGLAAITTFFASIWLAPNIVNGIMIGGALAIVFHLLKSINPEYTIEKISDSIISLKFDGQIYFANSSFFEAKVLSICEENKDIKDILIIGDGINAIDATGDNMLKELLIDLRKENINMIFVSLKKQVITRIKRGDFYELATEQNFYENMEDALGSVNK